MVNPIWWIFVLFLIIIYLILSKIIYEKTTLKFTSETRLDGKIIVMTGATGVIGKIVVEKLCKRGAKIFIGCRNLERGNALAEYLNELHGQERIVVHKLDLSDFESVHKFASLVLQQTEQIDILINNAGIFPSQNKSIAPNGSELTMCINYFGHFLLTNLLLDKIKENGRIINATSVAHILPKTVNMNNLNFEENYLEATAYFQSKLCMVLFTVSLAEMIKNKHITCNCYHPGTIHHGILENEKSNTLSHYIARLFFKDRKYGADTVTYLAVDEQLCEENGKYFVDLKERMMNPLVEDKQLRSELWQKSIEIINKNTSYLKEK